MKAVRLVPEGRRGSDGRSDMDRHVCKAGAAVVCTVAAPQDGLAADADPADSWRVVIPGEGAAA